VYDLSYFFGFFVSVLLYWALSVIFTTKKQRSSSPFVMELHAERRRHDCVESLTEVNYEGENIMIGVEEVV